MTISRRTLFGSSLLGSSLAVAGVARPARAAGNVLRIGIGSSLGTLDPMMTTIGDE